MGLDMYLGAKKYMSKHFDKDDSEKIQKIDQMFGIQTDEDGDYHAQEIYFRIGYWRKANAIHNWFVENCQGGIDKCQETYVSREQLETLRNLCQMVLDDKSKPHELLPAKSGFFFGGTDYDEWYTKDLEYTVTRLTKILNDSALLKMDFYYQSSW